MTGVIKRWIAVGTASLALAGGAALTASGTASAASLAPAQHKPVRHVHCHVVPGHWTRTWHRAYRDHKGHLHAGYWTRTWHPAERVCSR
ncbi:hypothetical protein ACIHAA_23655 [Streptomyces sp. NPDC052040]|uniref:hypothetical protein n=1 Tax=unclassified Streptomyces TaxID=2593676 RepID=UPI0037CDB15C